MKKKLLWPILDAMFAVTGLFVSLAFYFFANVTSNRLLQTARTLPVLVIATLAGLIISGIYKTILRYASSDTFIQAITGTLILPFLTGHLPALPGS